MKIKLEKQKLSQSLPPVKEKKKAFVKK